jgi:hypothetical protein
MTEITVHGVLHSDGTLEIDQPVGLPPGEVRVTIESMPQDPKPDFMAVLEEIWAERKQLGMKGRSKEEIDADIDAMREEWDERERELDACRRASE